MRSFFFAGLLASMALLVPAMAAAEESIIKQPFEHPRYGVDLEPHVLVGYGVRAIGDGSFGVGVRGTFILVENGFVPSINNNVGLGVGADGFFGNKGALDIPIVMQWNFFLSTHWTVFGEPGLGFNLGADSALHPILAVGGRYHFTEGIALTMRIGYPAASVGVSFWF